MNTLYVSPAPHIHGPESTRRIMRDVLIALTPVSLSACYFGGLSVVAIIVTAVVGCVLLEYLIQRFLFKQASTVGDLSAAVTGLLLALNLPALSPLWMVLIGCVVAIGIAKLSFGGLGKNLFNPALVARVVLLVSFPVQMTNFATGNSIFRPDALEFPNGLHDAVAGATPLGIIKEGLAQGLTLDQIQATHDFHYIQMFFGAVDGAVGEVSIFAILLGLIYLLCRRVIRWHIPVAVLGSAFVFSLILRLANPAHFMDPVFVISTGGLLLGAVFMATDYVTSPMNPKGMLVYGAGIGLITVIIRNWGAYPEGLSFAILFMNALTPLINKAFRSSRYGAQKEVKHG